VSRDAERLRDLTKAVNETHDVLALQEQALSECLQDMERARSAHESAVGAVDIAEQEYNQAIDTLCQYLKENK
jgi:hypothetical protein